MIPGLKIRSIIYVDYKYYSILLSQVFKKSILHIILGFLDFKEFPFYTNCLFLHDIENGENLSFVRKEIITSYETNNDDLFFHEIGHEDCAFTYIKQDTHELGVGGWDEAEEDHITDVLKYAKIEKAPRLLYDDIQFDCYFRDGEAGYCYSFRATYYFRGKQVYETFTILFSYFQRFYLNSHFTLIYKYKGFVPSIFYCTTVNNNFTIYTPLNGADFRAAPTYPSTPTDLIKVTIF